MDNHVRHAPLGLLGRMRRLMRPAPARAGAAEAVRPPAGAGRAERERPLRLSLALQGGGSFGAFTWGVLDRLLEERGIVFDTVSGSSAGAVNAALLASGLARGGREGARATLERFWRRASGVAPAPQLSLALSAASRVFSPYQMNPFDFNPLRDLLESAVDVALLRERSPVRLVVGATRVRDGRLHVFREHEITVEMLLASACLPLLHRAVEIDGEAYWDGGYAANPPLLPLIDISGTPDILVVQIIPSRQKDVPHSSTDITRRLDQMMFNASLVRDLDVLDAAQMLARRDGAALLGDWAIHRIAAEDHFAALSESNAMRLDWSFLSDLREAGRGAAARWLAGPEADQSGEAAWPSPDAQSASSPARKVG